MENETPEDRKRRLSRERGKRWRAKPDVQEKKRERELRMISQMQEFALINVKASTECVPAIKTL
jgi:hypothetical protein